MKMRLRNYLYFSKTQRNGFVIVICFILLLFLLPNILSDYLSKPATNFSEFKEDVIEFEQENTRLEENNIEAEIPIQLFSFDPNTVTEEDLIKLGIKPSVATTFIKYRNAGAKFYNKEDIKRVYGITESDYSRLAPYIQIKQKIPKNPKPKVKEQPKIVEQPLPKQLTPFAFNPNDATKETLLDLGLSDKVVQTVLNFRSKGGKFWKKQDFKKIYGLSEKNYLTLAPFIEISPSEPITPKSELIPNDIPQSFSTPIAIKVDINNSNVEDWKKLKGIGEITAKRIVNFRDKLGGFTSLEQIKMTYNVPDSVIDKVATQLIISPIPNKIQINTISVEDLRLHPYIKTKQAHVIINYRTNHGPYRGIDDLYKIKALKPETIERIQPYLSFED